MHEDDPVSVKMHLSVRGFAAATRAALASSAVG
jgi:hypothetical protein